MSIRKYVRLFLSIAFMFLVVCIPNFCYSQACATCIEAPIIGSTQCTSCAPDDWEIYRVAPEVHVANFGSCVVSTYEGSGVIGLQDNSYAEEGVITTIYGLTPGADYFIGFEVSECHEPGLLNYSIDGNWDVFDPSYNTFEELIVCFTASSDEVEIIFTAEIENPSSNHLLSTAILIDYLPCSYIETFDLPCNDPMELTLEGDGEICPGEEIQLFADIDPTDGNEVITWTSRPSDGINYLSDLSILDPVFNFPYTEENYGTYYTIELEVSNNGCIAREEVDIFVKPSEIPEFEEIIICSDDDQSILPRESIDGYQGYWLVPGPLGDYSGQTVDLVFDILPNQDNCLESYSYPFFITPYLVPEFDFDYDFCSVDNEQFTFSMESENGIIGEWEIEDFVPSDWGPGLYKNTYEPNMSLFPCSESIEVEFEIMLADEFRFDIPPFFCHGDEFEFPENDLDNFEGDWDRRNIKNLVPGRYENIFYSTDTDCQEYYLHEFEILSIDVDTIITNPTECGEEDGVIILSSNDELEYSIDSGMTWQMSGVFDSLSPSAYQVLYRHEDGGYCPDSLQFMIEGHDNPEIAFIEIMHHTDCNLPNGSIDIVHSSLNALEFSIDNGSQWQDALSFDNLAEGNYTLLIRFKSDPNCTTQEVFDIQPPEIPTLENLSVENVSDCMLNDGKIEITATGSNLQYSIDGGNTFSNVSEFNNLSEGIYEIVISGEGENCTIEDIIEIEGISVPIVDYDSVDPSSCDQSNGSISLIYSGNEILEYSIDDGLTWSSAETFSDLSSGIYSLVYRIKDKPNCLSIIEVNLASPEVPEIDNVIIDDNTDCLSPNGLATVISSTNDAEYSIDGITWSSENRFENLPGGVYIIQVRLVSNITCINSIEILVEENEYPELLNLNISPITNCNTTDGQIEITATGNDLQYSIDGGANFSSEFVFSQLDTGTYQVVILGEGENCLIESSAIVSGPEFPEVNLTSESPSSCTEENGSITVLYAGGELLEYSIDNEVSWQNDSKFTNLGSGVYSIIFRIENKPNCKGSIEVTLSSPDAPLIDDIIIVHNTDCLSSNGQIQAVSNTPNVEFSTDQINWNVDGTFEDLKEGVYSVYLRLISSPDCISDTQVEIISTTQEILDVTIQTTNPSECNLEDGAIRMLLDSGGIPIEFSIDGIVWQDDFRFGELPAGQYEVYIRSKENNNCRYQGEIELVDPDCPCDSYFMQHNVEPAVCEVEKGRIDVTLNLTDEIIWGNGETNNFREDLDEGWYYLTITYDEECDHQDSIYVEHIEGIDFILQSYPADCEDLFNGFVELISVRGGVGEYKYSMDDEEYQQQSGFYNLSPGDYSYFIKDDADCMNHEDFVIEIATERIDIILLDNIEIREGESLILNPLINISTIDSFVWTPSLSILNLEDLIIEVSPEEDISYTLTIYYGNNCIEERTIHISIKKNEYDLFLPNIISFDNTENNSFYPISNSEYTGTVESIMVYDRWGNLVFKKIRPEINNPEDGWIPSRQGNLMQGVYVYLIEYIEQGNLKRKHGSLTLLR